MKLIGKIAAIVCGAVVFLVIALQIVLNMPFVSSIIGGYAGEFIDGELAYSRLDVSLLRNFPKLKVTVDSLSLTYPHKRFPASGFGSEGRGEQSDTLLSVDRMTVAVNPFGLFSGAVTLSDCGVRGLSVYAHKYGSAANWQIFKSAGKSEKDSSSFSLPAISADGFIIDRSRLVYTDNRDRMSLAADLDSLRLDASLDSSLLKIRNILLSGCISGSSNSLGRAKAPFCLESDVEMKLSAGEFPTVGLSLRIPSAQIYYRPANLAVALSLDAGGSSTPDRNVDAEISRLTLSSDGINLKADGSVRDLLGDGSRYRLNAEGDAVLDSLYRFLSGDTFVGGTLEFGLNADVNREELKTYRFRTATLNGRVDGDALSLRMPGDSMDAVAGHPHITLSSNSDGLDLVVDMDSLLFDRGESLKARVRGMRNRFRIYKVEERGAVVPRATFVNEDRFAFVRAGDNRIGVMGAVAEASLQKRPARTDTLKRRVRTGKVHRELQEDDFADRNLNFKLDSSITAYLSRWKPSGELHLKGGFVSSPSFPLRTRFSSVRLGFTDNEIHLDSLRLKSGTSDISAKGRVRGLRRAFMGKGTVRADLDLSSHRLNINEILVAVDNGRRVEDTDGASEAEGTYVVDSLSGQPPVRKMPLIVVPANLDAALSLNADRVEISDISVAPFNTVLRMKDRTLQMTEASAVTNFGALGVDAFYATRSREDIELGANLRIADVSAGEIIHMLPSVDDMMPALKSFAGKFNLDLSATTQLDTNMSVIVPTLDGILRISGSDLMVSDAGDLRRITRLLLFKNKDIGAIDNLSVDAVVHDSKLEVFPFELSVDRYKLALRGMQGFDRSMNYHVSVMRSPFLIPFGINIYGYTDNWRFMLGPAKFREGKVPVFTQQLDTMQVNILQSIRDVYRKGVKNARSQMVRSRELALSGNRDYDVPVTPEEQSQLDSLNLQMVSALEDAELSAEVEDALQSSVIDLDKLMSEYQKATSDVIVERRMKKLKTRR